MLRTSNKHWLSSFLGLEVNARSVAKVCIAFLPLELQNVNEAKAYFANVIPLVTRSTVDK